MASIYDLAQVITGASSLEDGPSRQRDGDTITYYGTATSDSDSGTVSVHLSDDVTLAEGEEGTSVELPCTCAVSEGDTVMVTLVAAGNAVRVPTVTGVVGEGDLTRDIAESAQETANTVVAHFWHDSEGAHITETEHDATVGGNVLIDTDSLDIRDGTDVIATFRKDDTHGDGMAIELKHWRTAGIVASEDDNDWYLGINAGTVMGSKGSIIDLTSNGSRGTSILTMTDGGMTCSVTKGTYPNTNTVIRNLGFATSHGNISSQGTSAQAQFVTNGFMAMLMVGNDTTPTGAYGSKTLCTIPQEYRPPITTYYPVAKDGAPQSMSYVVVNASTGVVTLQNSGGTQSSVNYWTTCTWCY